MDSLEIGADVLVSVGTKAFVRTPGRCKICKHLPIEEVARLTLDLLLFKCPKLDIIARYSKYLNGSELNYVNLTVHEKHCQIEKLTEEDLRLLGLLNGTDALFERLFSMRFDKRMSIGDINEEIYRQRIKNLTEFQAQVEQLQVERKYFLQHEIPPTLNQTLGPQSSSGSVNFEFLIRNHSDRLRTLLIQKDAIESDIQKNIGAQERAKKTNLTVINIANQTVLNIEQQIDVALDAFQSKLEKSYPSNPELVVQVLRMLGETFDNLIEPKFIEAKKALKTEAVVKA